MALLSRSDRRGGGPGRGSGLQHGRGTPADRAPTRTITGHADFRENEMPSRQRLRSSVNELPSVALTTKFLALCEPYGSERLAGKVVIAGSSGMIGSSC